MAFDPSVHHRRSIRVRGYDYSQPGLYFVTVCTHQKRPILGEVHGISVRLSAAGNAVRDYWMALPYRFANLELDQFLVMPNHVHGIVVVHRPLTRSKQALQPSAKRGAASSAPTINSPTLGQIIRAFKSLSAIAVNQLLGRSGEPVWQRNYYEHIVRGGQDLTEIRRYIAENPLKWATDPENLGNQEVSWL